MTHREDITENPTGSGYLATMRIVERGAKGKPRVGKSSTLSEELAIVSQDAFMDFPASNIVHFENDKDGTVHLTTRFLGFFGPQGALPLNTTEEVRRWVRNGDKAFEDFANVFATRFLQLYFRTWSDARRVTQHDVPTSDRFQSYIASFMGTAPNQGSYSNIPFDVAQLSYAGVVSSRVKSTRRLKHLLEGVLGMPVRIQEHVPSWLEAGPEDFSKLGRQASLLGSNFSLGGRSQTISDKIQIEFETSEVEEYLSFIPSGENFAKLANLVSLALGLNIEAEVCPSLPANEIQGATLGKSAHMGWSSWLGHPDKNSVKQTRGASFSLQYAAFG